MRWSVSFLFLITILSYSNLHAQETTSIDEQAILYVFDTFFGSMRERDTTTLKTIIRATGYFFSTMNNDSISNTIKGIHAGNLKGFIKTVGNPGGIIGKCNNKFTNIDVQVYGGFSIITADYTCYYYSWRELRLDKED